MRWFRRRSAVATDIPADPEALDRLLARYVVDISDDTIEEICRNLAALPANRGAPHSPVSAGRPRGRAAPLFWPGVGVAFGMLMLGIFIGTPGMPVPLGAADTGPEFSDLLLPQGT